MKKLKFWETSLSIVWLLFCLWCLGFFTSCRSAHSIPQKECCSHSEVTEDKVNFDLVKKDGVTIILPTITKDSIK